MKERSVKRFKQAEIGDSVMIPLPDVDRSKAELRNVKGVVVEIDESGMYKLGTEHGLLNHLYTKSVPSVRKEIPRYRRCSSNKRCMSTPGG